MAPGDDFTFRRSSFCAGGTCIEAGRRADGMIVVRHATTPPVPAHTFTPNAWAAFLAAVRDGEFDRR